MHNNYNYTVDTRFLQYVQVDTEADPNSETFPSSAKQKNLAKILVAELLAMGITDAHMDEYGYVYATIFSNSENKKIPTICFCSHMDTSPDCSGAGVKPIVHTAYSGADIILPDDHTQVISTSEHPYLLEKIGDDIITASGLTLLGADDKAGIAIIMDTANYLITHPEIIHGDIRILFTPDEEIGKGVNHVDMQKLNAQFGYTLDGGELGSLEGDTFSANGVTVIIHGVSAHPGAAKDKLVNAIKIAADFVGALPKDSWSPETTEDAIGFVHPVTMEGVAEKATIKFIIRDFATAQLKVYEDKLESILKDVMKAYPKASYEFIVSEQYRNMREILDQHPQVIAYADEAMQRIGIKPRKMLVRGGTDGCRLSFMGLPCPNVFTGEMALHGKHEYVSIQDMRKGVATCVEIAKVWAEKTP
jgi:tripeptide aminopeptidase